MKSHYAIFASLYELYKNNRGNKDVLDKVAQIAWSLELDLGFDTYGYHSLAELCGFSPDDPDTASIQHYTEEIEKSLEALKDSTASKAV